MKLRITRTAALAALLFSGAYLSGCPTNQYNLGFVAGFAQDEEYWQGYDDSWDTRDGGTLYYTGYDIPFLDDGSYNAGYWDGVWYAYHDGYFVAYDYAFTIGFSEGYDLAYYPDWRSFIANDEHVEWLDGGFSDGYNDGFSEGRILGATDYRDGIAYDWFDAMWWYRGENDINIAELGVGTGAFGPVSLYVYGTDPNVVEGTKAIQQRLHSGHGSLAIRKLLNEKQAQTAEPDISYRSLTTEARTELSVRPTTSPRASRTLQLNTSWLDRVQQYQNSLDGVMKVTQRGVAAGN